jgi:hypothetical protein
MSSCISRINTTSTARPTTKLSFRATPTTVAKNDTHWNLINWWIDESRKSNYDTLHLYALDHLSCPAMATQCGRVFSAARGTLTPERNAFGLKILKAYGYLRWWRNGVVTGTVTACPTTLEFRSKSNSLLPY